ncbi:XdhC family protein [Dasania sp. GY-MA-18]|uniref:XdhC family protein n=1 Tax=Dasania phycosphaerae TaxID=2950436 RepID=A0A9J6RPS3_9GAMM|nr:MULTISPECIES: XdhC family protein [Dasania]MCR8923912.1 XdhC family protein [Dasania sp. GY-MA-18]MCZ0866346.1 XdhC family protein [Dasania phycosphaerae]MCZ0870070.1 XdhC family protein [Dasania phycosphaerae]
MDSSQLAVLQGAMACLQQGRAVTLVSVARTWGTSPRPVGSLLAVSADGRFYGSISGGCVEDDLISRLVEQPIQQPQLMLYGETDAQRHRFGLPCGGVLELVLEPLNNSGEVQRLIDAISQRQALTRQLSLSDGSSRCVHFQTGDKPQLSDQQWVNVFGPVWRLLIIGAGETSRYLAEMAPALGYSVAVCDPRSAYREAWPLSELPVLAGFPDDVVTAFKPDPRTAIVTLSHDPRVDDMALLTALKSEAFYVGALGSKATSAKRRQRFLEHFDFTEVELARLHAPVGLAIGSKTPAEIALSVLAELTALKNEVVKSAPCKEQNNYSVSSA